MTEVDRDERESWPDPSPSTDLYRLAGMVIDAFDHGEGDPELPARLLAAEARHFEPVVSRGCTWRPWSNGFAVGFEVVQVTTGLVRYVYLNPSTEGDDDADGALATTFLYWGPAGDPATDRVLTYVDVHDSQEEL